MRGLSIEDINSPMGVAFVVAPTPSVLCELPPDPVEDSKPVNGDLVTGEECKGILVVAMAAVACVGCGHAEMKQEKESCQINFSFCYDN